MKTKKFEKKLALNKKTVANLNNVQLSNVKGGGVIPSDPGFACLPTFETCGTCAATCDTCFTECVTCVTCVSCQETCDGYTCDGKLCNQNPIPTNEPIC